MDGVSGQATCDNAGRIGRVCLSCNDWTALERSQFLPYVTLSCVAVELVSGPEIGRRLGVSREALRLWRRASQYGTVGSFPYVPTSASWWLTHAELRNSRLDGPDRRDGRDGPVGGRLPTGLCGPVKVVGEFDLTEFGGTLGYQPGGRFSQWTRD